GNFIFKNLISSVKESINEVKKQGVNLIVVAASGGLTKDPVSNQTITMKSNLNIGDVLVKEFSKDVDVFLFGNLPVAYSSQKSNKVYSLLGNSGKSVNKIEITFEKVKNSIKLTNSKIQNVSMKTFNPSVEMLEKLEQHEKDFYYWLQEPIFTSNESFLFSKYMTLITDDAITEFLNKTIIDYSKASIGIWNIFNPSFQGVPQGSITRKHIYNMIGRTTSVKLIKMSGKNIETLMLRNLDKLSYQDGKITFSKDLVQEPWLFNFFENLEYSFQVNEGKKILKVSYSGKNVEKDDIFYVSVPTARLVGKEPIVLGEIVEDIELPVQRIIFERLYENNGILNLNIDNNRDNYVKLTYTVQPGDTLRRISYRLAIPEEELMKLNPIIKDPNIIRPGWELIYYRRYLDLIPPLKEFFDLQ
ncbi:MAG: LysM peptidoglycan-binding domain-containing protein, partial [Fervidobacterium sp.]